MFICSLADSQTKAFTKLKKFPNKETVQQLIDDFTHSPSSSMGKLKDTTEDLKDSLKRKYQAMSCTCSTGKGCCGHCRYEWHCCKPGPHPTEDRLGSRLSRMRKMVVPYIDLVKDTFLVVFIIDATGYLGQFSADVTLFQNAVIRILIATVLVPLFVSAAKTSARYPLAIFEFPVWRNFNAEQPSKSKLAFIRLLVFCCYIFVPAVLINNREKAKLKRQMLQEKGKEDYDSNEGVMTNAMLEEQEQIETYLEELRKGHLIFKKTEAALELWIQQSIQLAMLLLSMTRYPVDTGLQGIFRNDFSTINSYITLDIGNVLLLLSVSWSFRTGIRSFLKIHSEQKAGMLSGAAKAILGLRALLFSVTKIVCVIVFFGPFLGLKDCMAHWHAEGFQLEGELLKKLLQGSKPYMDRDTVDLIYRPQDNTNYTLVTLQAAFFIFAGVTLLHGIAIFILKINLSSHFKSTIWLNKIGHVVESLNVPDVYKDFDIDIDGEEERTTEQYQKNHDSVLKETLGMICLQMVSNLFLLVPLLVTGGANISL